jgi:hypothetical protein
MFCKSIIKTPICFAHYCMTILRDCPLYLVHLPLFRCLLRHLPIRYVAVCRLCECVSGVPVCGLYGHFCIDNVRKRERYLYKKSLLLARQVFRNNSCVLVQ